MKKLSFLVLFLCIVVQVFGQRRQSDSLRLKQMQYNLKLKEDAKKQKEVQVQASNENPFVVVSYDSKGNKVETYKSSNGERVTTTTIKIPSPMNKKFNVDTIDKDSISIQVVKSKFRMQVMYKGKVLTMYKSVFGPQHLEQKRQEGDRRTPEGTFTIMDVKKHEKWDVFMLLDYPNQESYMNFEKCKEKCEIPKTARIGGAVGIHGIWQNGDNVIDLKHNWTDGCVALKNKDVEELAKIVKPGVTKITILR